MANPEDINSVINRIATGEHTVADIPVLRQVLSSGNLGEVKQPVSRQQICDFSGENARTVQSVLNEWEQFLHELLKDEQKRYSVYHASFRDFLHRKDILDKTGLTIPGIHLLIAKDQLNKWKNRRRDSV